ncbi:MAG TPA: SDR family NAD(P)-dependent oxidoreductase [Candidatus Dormibacteraeota bacterium]|jgi:NAD(P)-dependent dehydrogenase (short-subunit alcohol dehydrogenase family)|nr:SDR family NAD(P)-dependent oxidoreductase [Candidatus Dormibacteraeota bacterium]
MAIRFDSQVAIVTGAGGGLGRCYALELASRGARVVVNDLGGDRHGAGAAPTAADATVAAIRDAGGEAVANHDTVSTPEGGAAIVRSALDAYGTVDIVINNAGILRDRSFANLTSDDVRSVVDVHLLGAFHVSQPAFRVMKEKRYGRLLFTSSAAGIFGNFGQANYGAAKMGLVGLSNVLAVEGARAGITSNVIAPVARSRMTEDLLGPQLASAVEPDLVMPMSLYLVSSECTLTHQIFSAGGGRFARVFVGVAPGWFAGPGERPTIEDVAAHMGQISSEDGYTVPANVTEELGLLVAQLTAGA